LPARMLKSKSYVPVFVVVALLIAGNAGASGTESPSRHHSHQSGASLIAQKIKAFKPGDRKSEARHFDFENYSFVTLDAAARRLFPSGTKLSYVDTVLKRQGRAVKSNNTRNGLVHYDYRFNFDRFACRRTVLVKFDNKTRRVISARGDGQCD
jgi:hypothetical protein